MKKLTPEYKREDGILTQVSTGDWKQLNHIELKKGDSVGGHYHLGREELFYVVRGELTITIKNKAMEDMVNLQKGDCLIVETEEQHTVYALKDSTVMELLSSPYTKEDAYVYQ